MASDPQAPAPTGLSPAAIGFAAGGLALLVALASGTCLYLRAVRAFQDEVRQGLVRVASTAAQLVDPALHESLVHPSQESSAAYAEAIRPLDRLLQGSPDIAFVYTCVLRDDGVHFVLDPTPAGDRDGDGIDDKSHLMDLYPDADAEMVAALRSGEPGFMAEPQPDAWGTFMSGYAPIRSADGRVVGIAGVDMDAREYVSRLRGLNAAAAIAAIAAVACAIGVGLSARSHRRRELQSHAALERLLQEVCASRERAEAAAIAKGEFLSTMSHELRTPLNGVLGMLGLLQDTRLDEDQREMASVAMSSGRSLVRLIDDVLDASRLAAGRVELEAIPFAPAPLAREVVQLLATTARPGVSLDCRVGPTVPDVVVGDPARLRQVVTNLVGNALKFTEKGRVDVRLGTSTGSAGARLVLEVEDTGIGIPAKRLGSLFSAFMQADSSITRRYGGSGLGLAISKRLVDLMGGELTVVSAEGRGSTFRVELPLEAVPA